MPLFTEVLKDVWKQKQAQREETATAIARQIKALETRKQRLIESVVDGLIDKITYDAQTERVGTELKSAQAKLSEILISAQDLECLLDLANWLLDRVAGIWAVHRQRTNVAFMDSLKCVPRPLFNGKLPDSENNKENNRNSLLLRMAERGDPLHENQQESA